ncbi:30S ribosomal protein S1 [Dolosicoccus paucivorans]|uniref:30S ribosomal protein S1 n=1 Tax=Dolosicoccus paucivorans TaxID=84521 RepID=A0A1G8KYF7_9LACT|nr:30S ribosomal protein S1 [Dolosicoccus paucivorans]PMB85118.1 30S ribosomal protein S1 [Dolosicoccus paucivorans]PMC58920.1 30S ribosomal protein S1 [Dolosicoccus paucivorans]SDI48565.1 small subunit ribosomal protein S1 [Dolosicoccus paucivorans]
MSEEVREETITSMEDALDSVKEVRIGDTVTADVLAFDDNQVRVAIQESGGLEGVIPRNELSSTPIEELTDVVNVGDQIEVVVVKPIQDKENGNYLLSKRRVDAQKVWKEIQEKAENDETITAPVTDVVKGGLVVNVGVRGFIPASMVEDFFVDDFSPYKGKELELKIIEVDPAENRLILSHKEISRAKREAERQEAMANLEEGSIVEGTVARLTNFGAFIDLNGVDGLVHISEIAHEHVRKPSDKLTVGETVKVKVLSVDEERGRVSLSIKDTQEGPWENIETKAPEGAELTGTVKRLTDFGAFVEVFPGVEGLVHISQIAYEHIAHPSDKLTEGEEVQVKVLSVDPERQRLSLSIKALQEKPEGYEEPRERAERSQRNSGERRRQPRRQQRETKPAGFVNDTATESSFSLGDMLGDALADFKAED